MASWLSVAFFCKLALANVPAPLISINNDLIVDVMTDEWCKWYERYPFGNTQQPDKCLSGDAIQQCSRFSENACSRLDASAYVTIAQFPKAFHLRRNFVTSLLGSGLSGWHVYDRDTSASWSQYENLGGDVNTVSDDDDWDFWKKSIGVPPVTNVCLHHYMGTTNLEDLTQAYYSCLTIEDIQTLITDVPLPPDCGSCDINPSTLKHGTTTKPHWYESKIDSDTEPGLSTDTKAYVGCLGIPGMRDDANQLCQGRDTSCLINKNSLSMRVCSLHGQLINKKWVQEQRHPLVEPFTHRVRDDGSQVSQFETVILKTPQSGDAYLQVFDSTDCSGTPTEVRQYNPPASTGAYALDLNTQCAKVVLTDENAACRCDDGMVRWDNYDTHTGTHHCMQCPPTLEHQLKGYFPGIDENQPTDFCFSISKTKCQQCPPNQYRADKNCKQCPLHKPKRRNWGSNGPVEGEFDERCTTCSDQEWFDTTEDPSECRPITEIVLQPGNALPQNEDFYHKDLQDNTISGYQAVNNYFFRVTVDGKYEQKKCSCVQEFQFPRWCGVHPIASQSVQRDAYVQKQVDGSSDMTVQLWSEVYDQAEWSGAELIRRGVCTDCNECDFHAYNTNCGNNLVDAGSCASCKSPLNTNPASGCTEDQYLAHKSDYGCYQKRADEDYTCVNCKFAEIEKIDGKNTGNVLLWMGCGLRDTVKWWDNSNQVQTCTYADETGCRYLDPSTEQTITFKNRRDITWPLNPEITTKQIPEFINVQGHGTKIPYCPPGFHIDARCLMDENEFETSEFRSDCCLPCQVGGDSDRKTDDYIQCTGATIADTQEGGFTTDCPAQTFTDMDVITDQKCKSCTSCPGQFI